MKRRTVLRSCGVAAALALAGCGDTGTGNGNGEGTTDEEPTTTDAETPTATTPAPTTTPPPSLSGREITVTGSQCGSGEDSATVTFDADAMTVTIEGVIGASDPCHVAEIGAAEYEVATETLTLTVVAVDNTEPGETCASCVGDVSYSVTARFRQRLPARVVVDHDGLNSGTITEATRDGE